MARYIVQVITADGRTLSLLVTLSPDQLCSALLDKVKSRLSANSVAFPASDHGLVLRLGAADGPLIDPEDLLADALTTSDVVFVTYENPLATLTSPDTQTSSRAQDSLATRVTAGKPVRVRVITPELAHSQRNPNTIPLLPHGAITLQSTLKELELHISRHLDIAIEDDQDQAGFNCFRCNCNFARKIDAHGTLNQNGNGSGDALKTLVVVYDNNNVVCLPLADPSRHNIDQVLQSNSPAKPMNTVTTFIGGVQSTQSHADGAVRYLKLPVIAICSSDRHKDPNSSRIGLDSPRQRTVLDLHTSEMPIHITVYNYNKTLSEVGLEDCLVNGVLDIYAVKRLTQESNHGPETLPSGKDGIYRQQLSWNLLLGQSERGLANFLSSLRQFASLSHASSMESSEQDAILHIMMLLTRFPPAVRSMHILMLGETPRAAEQAAIVQCLNEVLKMVVPLRVVQNKTTRLLEGSRLLFGLILEKVKHLKVSMQEGSRLPYMDTFIVHDLRNFATMEPVADPIQTDSGLVDAAFFDTFKSDGLLHWTNEERHWKEATLQDRKLQRACLLSGGVKPRTVAVDIDAINSTRRYTDGGKLENVIATTEFANLQYLANLCSRNSLGVLHPSALPSANPPVLTLDRAGLLAQYVGRQPCGTAGRDINMFRPTSTPVEEAVDVSIITQLLVPILKRRDFDGTAIFEAFGDQNRQIKDPEEVVVLCVDASASMDDRCGFIDVEENEDDFEDDEIDSEFSQAEDEYATDSETENMEFERPALDELKEFLATHESFDDFLAISQAGNNESTQKLNAEKVLKLLRDLNEKQIVDKKMALTKARRRTSYYYRQQCIALESSIATLENRNIRLKQYQDSLSAFLIYRSENRAFDEPLT